jgi:pyruvate dehydrogenase E2 component (dihydrolipoamide acetyltransferase)
VFDQPSAVDEAGRVKASPIARRLARKLGVDLATVRGTGPGGRVVKEDVEAAASAAAGAVSAPQAPTQAPAEPPPPETWQPPEPPPEAAEAPAPGYQEFAPDQAGTGVQETAAVEQQPFVETESLPAEPALVEPASTGTGLRPETTPAPLPLPGEMPPLATPAETPGGMAQESMPPLMPPSVAPGMGAPGIQPGAGLPPIAPSQPQQPVQPLPGPAPFVSGMTGGFPAIQPGMPGMPQAPMQPGMPATGMPPLAQPPAATATRGQSVATELTGPQQTVARRMAESKATAPDFFVEVDVDMTNAVNYREQLKMAVQPAPSFNDMVIKACALALRQFPKVNGAYKDGHFEQYGDVNVGFVVAAGELLAVPTLYNADQKGLAQIARESTELANAVRMRSIQPAQLSGGTFSISNLGMYGVDRFTAILNPPQAAILAVGAIKRKPVIAEDGISLAVRQIMALTLTCDHRILYGAEGAEFLAAVKTWLENPQSLPV